MAIKRGADRDRWEVFLTELSRHGSIRKACAIAGVDRRELRQKQKEDDEFSIMMADAEEDSVDRIAETAHTIAQMGDGQMVRYLLDQKRYKKTGESTIIPPSINITIGSKK